MLPSCARSDPFVPCVQEYLNFRGGKFGKSRGAAVDVPYFLSRYDPDPLRYYLTATAPETRIRSKPCVLAGSRGRTLSSPKGQPCPQRKRGNELVATWGTRSVANRMLSFAYKRFDGKVPEPGPLDAEDRALLARVEAGFEAVGALYDACKFRATPPGFPRAGLGEAMGLAREANVYLDRKAPWFQIKEDPAAAATSVYVTRSVRVVDNLKTILAPVLPSQRSACTSTWATRGSCDALHRARSRSRNTRKKPARTWR